MDKIKIEQTALVLDSKEKESLTQCLKYCLHRLENHPNSEASRTLSGDFIKYMIKNLND